MIAFLKDGEPLLQKIWSQLSEKWGQSHTTLTTQALAMTTDGVLVVPVVATPPP